MTNAVFDTGYYQFIRIVDMHDVTLIEKRNSPNLEAVPNWFIDLVDFEVPIATAVLQKGWMPIGTLEVQSHPGFAYSQLWQSTVELLKLFFLTTLVSLLLIWISIKWLLEPLKKLESQASEILNKKYLIQKDLPATTELKQVVVAVNGMVIKLKSMFERDAKLVDKLQEIAYKDDVTGFSNRRHFNIIFTSILNDEEIETSSMALLKLHGLSEYNSLHGFLKGNQYVQAIAHLFKNSLNQPNAFFARLNGSELILIAPGVREHQLLESVHAFMGPLKNLLSELPPNSRSDATSLVVTNFHYQDNFSKIMSHLEFGLNRAIEKGPNECFHYNTASASQIDLQNWNDIIDDAFANKRFRLFQQQACNSNGSPFLMEALIRLIDPDNTLHNAGSFMPAVEQLERQTEIDHHVCQLVVEYIKNNRPVVPIAINLSIESLINQSEFEKILHHIDSLGKHSYLLAVEVMTSHVELHIDVLKNVIKQLQKRHVQFGLDQFAQHLGNTHLLPDLRPNYVKLGNAFYKSVIDDVSVKDHLSRLVELCDDLGINVIAMMIEAEYQKTVFAGLNIDLYQGALFGSPEPFKTNIQTP
jgi:EAL domain-containing protein (putative c-di-GMP-specific phosphodiesterase class I)/GGDEF domain-containing protein